VLPRTSAGRISRFFAGYFTVIARLKVDRRRDLRGRCHGNGGIDHASVPVEPHRARAMRRCSPYTGLANKTCSRVAMTTPRQWRTRCAATKPLACAYALCRARPSWNASQNCCVLVQFHSRTFHRFAK
jgi:hypothetical protein